MNFSQLTQSSNGQIIVGDLGSDKKNESYATYTVKGSGTEEGILQFAHEQLKGKEIVSESVERLKDGKLQYVARYKSENGI